MENEVRYSNLTLERLMPLLAYENDILLSKTGDMTALLEVELPEIFSCGESDYDNLHQMWVRALSSLPVDSIVHKQDIFVEKKFRLTQNKERTFLSAASDRHFNGRRFLDHHCYVYITKCPPKHMRMKASSSPLNLKGFIPSEKSGISEGDFETSVASFIAILAENGLRARRLTVDEVIGNETSFGIVEQYMNLDFNKKSVLNDISIYKDYFKVGDRYVSMFSITDLDQLPLKVRTSARHARFSSDNLNFSIGYPSSLCLALGFSHIYNQYFFIEDTAKNLKEVEISITRQRAFSAVSRENAVNMQFNEEFIDDVTRKAQRTVRCSFNIIAWDADLPQLLRKNNHISARLANLDITASRTLQLAPQMFWGGIPGGASCYPVEMTFLTAMEQGCCFINNETNYHTSESGFGLRLCDRISGVPINVDISDEPRKNGWIDNRNKFILGPSGSGKSFFTNHMVRQYWEQGTHVVIVDVGDSYLGLCRQINEETGGRDGVYYTYKEDDPIRFNPFYVADGQYTVEKREQLRSLMFILWKGDHDGYTKAEETHISTAVNNFIDRWVIGEGRFPTFNLFYDFLQTEMREYVRREGIQRDNFDIENLIQVLRPYYKGGTYDYLLNATENLDLLHKRFIVFEIDNIKDHPTLFPVVTLVLMDTFISKMRHPAIAKERKMILIEEAWKAISKNNTAEFIKYLYKTVRKHFGEAIVVTQEVDDIISNPIVKESIISNADCKILLDQRKYQNKFEVVQNVLALTDKERAIALSVNRDLHTGGGRSPYKEVFITLNGNHTAVYAVEVSREEYLTYTTEKTEKERLFALAKSEGSMQKAIERYIREEKQRK